MDIAMSEAIAGSLQPLRLVLCWVWRSYCVRTTSSGASPVRWEQNSTRVAWGVDRGSVSVMRVNFLDVRWDAILSVLCLTLPWLLWVISYHTVVSRPYKPTGSFHLHRRPDGIKWQTGTAKRAGLPLKLIERGGKHKLTCPSKPSDTQLSSAAKQSVHLPEKLEDRWENT